MHFSLRHHRSVMILPLVLLAAALGVPSSVIADAVTARSAKEQKFAARLTSKQIFRTRKNDTFSDLASILYGHASWWEKIRAQNPNLATYGEVDRLPQGTIVTYLAPQVGDNYVVQPGDYLIRIAAWKYGDMKAWEQLYQQNKARISNPNLIRPGDRLDLDPSGRMVNRETGQVVFDNLNSSGNSLANRKPAVEGPPRFDDTGAPINDGQTTPPEETLATLLGLPPTFTVAGHTFDTAFVLGFALGCLMLLILPLQWLIAKSRRRKASADTSLPFRYVAPPEEDEDDELLDETHGLQGFKKRPLELYRFDRSLIPSEKGEAAKAGGYQSLSSNKKRKYLKRKAG